MASTALTTKLSINLTTQKDWDQWFDTIRKLAESHRVWEYVDPSREAEIELVEPVKPIFPANPTAQQLDQCRLQYTIYQDDYRKFERKEQALIQLRTLIRGSIDRQFLHRLRKCTTIKQEL